MKVDSPLVSDVPISKDNFLSLDNFSHAFRNAKWYGIENPCLDERFSRYLIVNKYKKIRYDMDKKFDKIEIYDDKNLSELCFFGCYIFYNSNHSLIFNWFRDIIIINDKTDVFNEIFGVKMSTYAEEYGGRFNDKKFISGSEFIASLNNNKKCR